MIESGYYPPGAEFDPSAPYNESEPPEIEVDVEVKETLVRTSTIVTNNIYYVSDEEGTERIDDDFEPVKEYEEQFDILPTVIASAKAEIEKIRKDAEAYLRKLEAHYGVKRGCIPGCSKDETDKMKMRKLLFEASDRVRFLKNLEDGLDGWEREDIEVEY